MSAIRSINSYPLVLTPAGHIYDPITIRFDLCGVLMEGSVVNVNNIGKIDPIIQSYAKTKGVSESY